MKIFLIVLLCACVFSIARTQQTDDEKIVLSLITGNINPRFNVYSDDANTPPWVLKQVNLYLEKDTILSLSAPEKAELNNKILAAQHSAPWPGKTLENIPLLSSDTIKKITGDSTKGWQYFKKKYAQSVHTIARPIFFRNNTICIVFFDCAVIHDADPWDEETSFGCQVVIYVKTGNIWAKKITVLRMVT